MTGTVEVKKKLWKGSKELLIELLENHVRPPVWMHNTSISFAEPSYGSLFSIYICTNVTFMEVSSEENLSQPHHNFQHQMLDKDQTLEKADGFEAPVEPPGSNRESLRWAKVCVKNKGAH